MKRKSTISACTVAKYLIRLNKEACQEKEEYIGSQANRMEQEEIETGISKLKLQKLLYYCQGYHLAVYGKPMFEDEIQAWQHGPVIPSVYQEFKRIGGNFIPAKENMLNEKEKEAISQEKREIIEDVFDLLGHYDAWKLRNKTHEEAPWIEAQRKSEQEQRSNVTIETKDMQNYFSKYVKK